MSGELIFPETGMTARDEVRVSAFGVLRCPSCGELAAEILGKHRLALAGDGAALTAECRDGQPVTLDGYGQFEAAANIALADEIMFREEQAWRAMGFPA